VIEREVMATENQISLSGTPVCTYCNAPVNNMKERLEEETYAAVKCKNCGKDENRETLETNLKITSSGQYSESVTDLLRKNNLNDPLNEEVGIHLSVLKKTYNSQVEMLETLRQYYQNQLKLRDERIRCLENSATENDMKVQWKVKNWSTVKKKAYLQSERFALAGFTCFIGLYPDADKEDSRGYISLYLYLDGSSVPKGKSINIEFALKFINGKDIDESVEKVFKTTFPVKGNHYGWGERKAIQSSRIREENGFLIQDVLSMEAHIVLKKVNWEVGTKLAFE